MSSYQNAGMGLKKMHIAAIGMIVCSLLILIPVINIFALVGVMVFVIINAYGIYQAGKDISGVRLAFYLQMIVVVLTLISNLVSMGGDMDLFFTIATEVLAIVAMCLIFSSVSNVMEEQEKEELAKQGKRAILIFSLMLPIIACVLQIRFYKNSAEQFGAG